MQTRPDWHTSGFLDRVLTLDLPDFAQEFLLLNQDYVRGYRTLARYKDADEAARQRNLHILHVSGGSDFPVDPSIPAWSVPALWAPEALSAIIALIRAPEIYAAGRFAPLILTPQTNAVVADDGLHVIVGDRGGPLRLWISDDCHEQAAVVIPLDESCWVRLHHLRRFIERLYGRTAGPLPNTFRPTRYRVRRLAHALQALTAKQAGATARDIAALTDPGVKTLSGSIWKDVHQRARVERLLTLGEQLAAGEYLALLQYGRRPFPTPAPRATP